MQLRSPGFVLLVGAALLCGFPVMPCPGADPAAGTKTHLEYSDRLHIIFRPEGMVDAQKEFLAKLIQEEIGKLDLLNVTLDMRAGPLTSGDLQERARRESIHAFLLVDAKLEADRSGHRLHLQGKLIFPDVHQPFWEKEVDQTTAPSPVMDKLPGGGRKPREVPELLEAAGKHLTGMFFESWVQPIIESKSKHAVLGLQEMQAKLDQLRVSDRGREAALMAQGFARSAEKSFAARKFAESLEHATVSKRHYERAIEVSREDHQLDDYRADQLGLMMSAIRKRLDAVSADQTSAGQARILVDLQTEYSFVDSMRSRDSKSALERAEALNKNLDRLLEDLRSAFDTRVQRLSADIVSLKEWEADRIDGKTYKEILETLDAAVAGYERRGYSEAWANLRRAEVAARVLLEYLNRHARENAEEEYRQNLARATRLIKKLYLLAVDTSEHAGMVDALSERLQTLQKEYDSSAARLAAKRVTDLFRECVQTLRRFQDRRAERLAELKRERVRLENLLADLSKRSAAALFPAEWTAIQERWRSLGALKDESLVDQSGVVGETAKLINDLDRNVSATIERPFAETARLIQERKAAGKPWEELERKRRLAEIYIREGLVTDAIAALNEIKKTAAEEQAR